MKYEPLAIELRNVSESVEEISLTFEEIESIIGEKLPRSAFTDRTWWANTSHRSLYRQLNQVGFKVGKVNLEKRFAPFRRLEDENLINPNISKIVEEIESRASRFEFGNLQSIRKKQKNLERLHKFIFGKQTISSGEGYAYHYGGRNELQFNIGEDKFKGSQGFRYGVAISLHRGPALNQISGETLQRFKKLNEFIELRSDEYQDFYMYEHMRYSEEWSDWHELRPVPARAIKLDSFIFIGKFQESSNISPSFMLRDFDRLLEMYKYVEGEYESPYVEPPRGVDFKPGLTKKPSKASTTSIERKLDRNLRHNEIQYALGKYLIELYGKHQVRDEFPTPYGMQVDLAVKHGEDFLYYEIKVESSARQCIRQAIGQLLEYSYWPQAIQASKLIVIGEPQFDDSARTYLKTLQDKFEIPIFYNPFDMNSCVLVKD